MTKKKDPHAELDKSLRWVMIGMGITIFGLLLQLIAWAGKHLRYVP